MIERSETWLRGRGGPDGRDLQRFWDLGVYPADAELDVQLLADLWGSSSTQALRSAQRITEVGLTSIRLPDQTRPLTVVLHDPIVDYLHRERCRPGQFPELHRRCAAPSIGLDGHPHDLSPARARWLVHLLVSAAEWAMLEKMASLRCRRALLDCTGSDAAFLDALDGYAKAALEHLDPVEAASHYFSAVLLAAHVRAVIGAVPIAALATNAQLGNPVAALVQAANRPDAGTAFQAVLAAASTAGTVGGITSRAVELAGTIPDDRQRTWSLGDIAQKAAPRDPVLAAELVDRAVALARTIFGDRPRSEALAEIAGTIGDLTRFASSLNWRTTELNRFLNAVASFASSARSLHPDIAFAQVIEDQITPLRPRRSLSRLSSFRVFSTWYKANRSGAVGHGPS